MGNRLGSGLPGKRHRLNMGSHPVGSDQLHVVDDSNTATGSEELSWL